MIGYLVGQVHEDNIVHLKLAILKQLPVLGRSRVLAVVRHTRNAEMRAAPSLQP
jgi:SPX domain protein involved in polyphosphate accumulation